MLNYIFTPTSFSSAFKSAQNLLITTNCALCGTLLILISLFASPSLMAKDGEKTDLENALISSYALGRDAFETAKSQGMEIDSNSFIEGFQDASRGAKAKYTNEEVRAALKNFQEKWLQKKEAEAKTMNSENEKAGADFLTANAKNEGVQVTNSGLQYRIIETGSDKKPNGESEVTCHYEGKLLDGKVFDSSYKRGQPATFPLNRVIPGWTEGLQLIGEGGKIELFIPSELGYGDQGAPPSIPGGATLIFTVELLKIN